MPFQESWSWIDGQGWIQDSGFGGMALPGGSRKYHQAKRVPEGSPLKTFENTVPM